MIETAIRAMGKDGNTRVDRWNHTCWLAGGTTRVGWQVEPCVLVGRWNHACWLAGGTIRVGWQVEPHVLVGRWNYT